MEDEQHHHFLRRERKNGSQAEEDSPPYSSSQAELPEHKSELHSSSSSSSSHEHYPSHSAHSEITTSMATTPMSPASINYNVNVQFEPATPQAGKPTSISFVVTEQKVGEPIKQFDIIHDKLMHLIIVNREDLSHFAHIHPKLDKEGGIFYIAHTFAKAGKYKMWIDVKPKEGIQILTAFAFNVEGQPVHFPASIVPEQTNVKNVVAEGHNYQITLNYQPEQQPVAGRNIKMTFEIRDADGKPISNLEPLMAAGGHCVIIDADSREFLHVHPSEEIPEDVASWRGGPSISFLANFPKPGLYRAWGQFQHEGTLITADFTFEVHKMN
jgi:hypothetical protein